MKMVILSRVILFAGFFLLLGFSIFLQVRPNLKKGRLLRISCLLLAILYLGTISYFRLTHLDLPQGQVTQMELPEGIYSGQVKDGIPQGVGSLTFADESVVTANFENGYATGKGRITFPDGSRYVGELQKNRMWGEGTYTLVDADGNVTEYTGSFVDGVLSGEGTIQYIDGSSYAGSIQNLQPNGKGVLLLADGSKYEGEFLSGYFHGNGNFTCASCGHTYTGSFVCGMMQGNGTLTMKNGNEYTGGWLRDSLNNRLFWCASPYYDGNYYVSMGKPFESSIPDFYQD